MRPHGLLMTPENVAYLSEKRIYTIYGNMLAYLLDHCKESPEEDPILLLLKMFGEQKGLQFTAAPAEIEEALVILGIKKPLDAFLAIPTQKVIIDLHQRFQGHLAMSVDDPVKVKQRRQLIQTALDEFALFSIPVVQRIVHELPRRFAGKSIPPLTEGGDTYLFEGLVIRMAGGTENAVAHLGSHESAAKVLSHESKAIGCVLSANICNLHMPLSVKVSYLSHSFWVHTRLPLSPESLVYGSIDAGKTMVKNSCIMNGLTKRLGEALHLKPHIAGQTRERAKVVHTPADVQGYHCQADGRFYLMSVSRLFPPTTPEPHVKNSYLVRMLRPEAVQGSANPLSSDAFSPFCMDPKDNEEVHAVTQGLFSSVVPKVAALLLARDQLTCEQLVDIAHREGLNCRYFGRLFPAVAASRAVTVTLSTELAARTFRRLLEDEWYANSQAGAALREYEDSAIKLFHLLLDSNDLCHQFWKERLVPRLVAKYGSFNSLSSITFAHVDRLALFIRCCELTGCRFGGRQVTSFPEFQVPVDCQPQWAKQQTCQILPVCKVPAVRPLTPAEELNLTGNPEQSSALYQQVLERMEGALGPAAPCLIPVLNGLAQAYKALGPGCEAEVERHLSRVIVLRDMDEGVQDTCYMEALRVLADFYMTQQNYDAAAQALQTAISLFRQAFGDDHLGLPQFLLPLGNVFFWKRETEKALRCYLDALFIRKENYGAEHPEVADSLMHLGLLHLQLAGRAEEAGSYLKQALGMTRSCIGPGDHPTVARVLYHLAVLTHDAGRRREALQQFLECLPMLERCFGAQDSLVVGALGFVRQLQVEDANSLASKGALCLTDTCTEEAESDDEKELDDLLRRHEFAAAIPLFDDFLRAQREEYGQDSPEYAAALMKCGNNCLLAERHDLATEMFLEADKVLRAAFSPDHIYVADALLACGEAFAEARVYQEAATAFERAMAITDKVYAGNPASLCASWERVARFHFRFGKVAKALQLWRKVLETRAVTFGEDHPGTVAVREEMQRVYDEVDRLEERRAQVE
eukprot:GGOE01018982.1.p1 GENE.GGOE01018982.1~~GGOE01018982.1.p1  ORF type:complete len:1033 (-),score=259.59 GGOE01018982.1:306-3404(-)